MISFALVVLMANPPVVSDQKTAELPLRKVVLYENGLGYFERGGKVGPAATISIPLEANQLDDALKSLVVMSSKFVESVGFEPPVAATAAEDVVGVGAENEPTTVAGLVQVLKGADVVVQTVSKRELKGRIFDVVEEERHLEKGEPVIEPIVVLTGEAGLQRVAVKDIVSVRPVDARVRSAWERATIARSRFGNRDSITVHGPHEGGDIAVGYTTEAPVWKATYRLVLDEKKARLQGFALVHNDSDDAWHNVDITLASGKPNSFVIPMAGPRYAHREMLNVDDGLDVAPQLTSQETREHLRGPAIAGNGALGMHGVGSGGGGSMGYGSGVGGVSGHGSGKGGSASIGGVTNENLSTNPAAAVSEAGDLWLYKVLSPVSIPSRKSALVPFFDGAMSGERVAMVSTAGEVFTGVRLTNSSNTTLENGTMSLFVDGAFDGETNLDRLKPGEVRVMQHGVDLDVTAARTHESKPIEARDVQIINPLNPLLQLKLRTEDRHSVTVTSKSPRPRTLMVELNDDSFSVSAGATEEPRSPGQPRYARFKLGAGKEQTFEYSEQALVRRRYNPGDLTAYELKNLRAVATPDSVQVLTTLLAAAEKSENARRLQNEIDTKLKGLEADSARLKDLLAASKNARDTADKLGASLLAIEDQRQALRKERENLTEATTTVLASMKSLSQKQVSVR